MNVHIHWIELIPQSPIHIGEQKPNFRFLPTKEVIPGSVLRGALAEYLIASGRESEILDVVKDMKFGFLYPTDSASNLPLPIPKTALTCKSNNGFKPKGHGVFDSLLAYIAYTELKGEYNAEFPVPLAFKCLKCGDRSDKISGFYVKEKRVYKKVEVKRVTQTKVAINRMRKTAEKEMLYSITAVKPEIVYVGKVIAPRDKFELLIEAINEMGIGALTTRGYGKTRADEIEDVDAKLESTSIRFELFNEELKKAWEQIRSIAINKDELPEEPEYRYFSIDVMSPLIIRENLIPTLRLKVKLDEKVLDPILYFASPTFIGGWSTAWGLPKDTTYAADIGSTYVFRVEDEDSGKLYDLFRQIEVEGLGEKRDEGYGEVLACHPFHREVFPV